MSETTETRELKYGYARKLDNVSFDDAVATVTEALKAEGFGVLSRIDVEAALKEKLDHSFRPYLILGACNPMLAERALQADPHIGLLLPCNVVVQQTPDGAVEVSIADPRRVFTLVDAPKAAPVAAEADERLRRVMDRLA